MVHIYKNRTKIGRKLILFLVLFSSLITLVTTSIQLYRDYVIDIDLIDQQFEQVDHSFRESITKSLWLLDLQQIYSQLNGMLNLRDIVRVEISENDIIHYAVGVEQISSERSDIIDLYHLYNGKKILLGSLVTYASLDGVYSRLIDKVWVILISNGIKTFAVALFMYVMFASLVTRHVEKIVRYLNEIDFNDTHIEKDLKLSRLMRSKNDQDELDQLVASVNNMRHKHTQVMLERENVEKELRESKLRYELSLEFANVGTWEWNIVTNELYWSDTISSIFGYEQPINDTTYEKFMEAVHPEDRQLVNNGIEASFEGTAEYDLEHRIVWPNGQVHWVHEMGDIERNANGEPVKMLGVVRDISRRRKAEGQLRHSQKMEAVGQLTGGIAHDYNNILGIVQGNFEILARTLADDEKAMKRINTGLKGVSRGADLTRKLLNFASKEVSETETILVNDLIREIEDLIIKSLTVSIEIEFRLDGDVWNIDVNPGDLQDVIVNLSLNARDAMPEGGKLTIETKNIVMDEGNSVGFSGEFVMLVVSDTGHGMTPEVKERILEPFFTTKKKNKGTGLGLSMVYGFVQRSNGHIRIVSEVGTGSVFQLYLPRDIKQDLNKDDDPTKIEIPLTGSETILVVDDEDALRDVAEMYLQDLGYKILSAENGPQAIDILSRHPEIDLLFSDIVMPGGVDGYKLAIEAHDKYPELKILLTSGFTNEREYLAGIENVYLKRLNSNLLKKPYNELELSIAVRRAVKHS